MRLSRETFSHRESQRARAKGGGGAQCARGVAPVRLLPQRGCQRRGLGRGPGVGRSSHLDGAVSEGGRVLLRCAAK